MAQQKVDSMDIKQTSESEEVVNMLKEVLTGMKAKDLTEMLDEQQKQFEDPVTVSKTHVAVLEISDGALDIIDGWPGYYDVPRVGEFTRQGLPIIDRYAVITKYIPEMVSIYEYKITPIGEVAPQIVGSQQLALSNRRKVFET